MSLGLLLLELETASESVLSFWDTDDLVDFFLPLSPVSDVSEDPDLDLSEVGLTGADFWPQPS